MDLLDPLDAAMFTGELLFSPMHVGVVLILSPPTDAGADYLDSVHAAAVAGAQPVDRRLLRYPHRGVKTGGMWVWREVDTLDLSRHCRRRTSSSGDLWRLIGELDSERLDRSRPMWMSYLIDGLEGGRFAFYVKVHHTVIDGVGGLRMIADALSADPAQRSMPPFYADRRPQSPGPVAPGGLVSGLAARLGRAVGSAAAAARLIERVVTGELSTVSDALIGRVTTLPFGAPYTRFNGRPGTARAVGGGSWPKDRIEAVRQAAGVSANDVITAVVAGVVRQWLCDRGELPDRSLVAACPITVRSRDSVVSKEASGNMFGLWLCPLGTNLADPIARLQLIHRSMAAGKRWVAERGSAASLLTNAGSIAATVLPALLPLIPKVRAGYNLPISHVPGPRSEMYWNGAHVEEIYPVSTVYDGQAVNVTTCSYADRVGFGFVAGADVVADIDTFVPLTEACLAELETAVGACPG